jgi:hypothetical protein
MNLIEAPYRGRLGHELPNALVKGTVDEQIGAGDGSAAFVVERRPFAKNGRRIEINVSIGTSHRARAFRPILHPRYPLRCTGPRDFSGISARLRRRARRPRGSGGCVRVSPVPICLHFRQLLIGLNVTVAAEQEPDKSNRHQDGAGYDQPVWILHFGIPGSRPALARLLVPLNISALRFARRPRHEAPRDHDCSF